MADDEFSLGLEHDAVADVDVGGEPDRAVAQLQAHPMHEVRAVAHLEHVRASRVDVEVRGAAELDPAPQAQGERAAVTHDVHVRRRVHPRAVGCVDDEPCTAPAQLRPQQLRPQTEAQAVTELVDARDHDAPQAIYPPATAGRIVSSAPSGTTVSSPSRKRMSSPDR